MTKNKASFRSLLTGLSSSGWFPCSASKAPRIFWAFRNGCSGRCCWRVMEQKLGALGTLGPVLLGLRALSLC